MSDRFLALAIVFAAVAPLQPGFNREKGVDRAPYTGRPTGPAGSLAEQQRHPFGNGRKRWRAASF